MKKIVLAIVLLLSVSSTFVFCKNCVKCHAEVMGVKSPEQEYCGDQADLVKKNPGMVCEDK